MTNRRVWIISLAIVWTAFHAIVYWSYDIDSLLALRATQKILSPLEKKIRAAETGSLAAAAGLRDQKQKILLSLKEGYHRYLLPENYIYVDRLRRVNTQTLSSVIDSGASRLNPLSIFLINREADRWFLCGVLNILLGVAVGISLYRRRRRDAG